MRTLYFLMRFLRTVGIGFVIGLAAAVVFAVFLFAAYLALFA